MKKILTMISVVAMASLLVFACKKKDNVDPVTKNNSTSLKTTSLCADCLTDISCSSVPDSVVFSTDTLDWTAGPVRPGPFDPMYFDFTTGTASSSPSGQLVMSDEFNSNFNGNGCWKVGYSTNTNVGLDDFDCSTARSQFSTANICSPGLGFEPDSCKGWYIYENRVATTIRCVAVFCDANNDGVWDACEKGYIVCPKIVAGQMLNPSHPNYRVWAIYTFKYKCCPAINPPCVL